MNFDEIMSTLMTLAAVPLNEEDDKFQRIIPAGFLYAEQRIYHELSFLATDVTQPITLVAQEREVLLPSDVVMVRSIAVCTPPGAITRNSRRFYPQRISIEALDMFWPQANFKPGIPKWYTIVGVRPPPAVLPQPPQIGTQPLPPNFSPERFVYALRLAPSPDRAYTAEVFAGVQPKVLSQSNPETFLSVNYPELFIAACMVYITGYQRDYGAASDDPQRAMSWEAQYKTLRESTALEAGMQRGEGPGFTALPPATIAQTPRAP